MLIHGDMLQKLVNKIIEDIGYNINIIDTDGIIIASGNPRRIGTFHKVGKQASDEECRIDIQSIDENHYEGVKAGINQPFYHNNTLIGIIGITGIPSEINELSNIVKSMIELMYEQEVLKQKMYYRQSDKTFFLNELINLTDRESLVTTINWGEKLGYDMTTRRNAIVLEFNDSESNDSSFATQGKIQVIYQHIKSNKRHHKNDISTVVSSNRIVILKASYFLDVDIEAENLREYIFELVRIINVNTEIPYFIACGSFYDDIYHIKSSYYEAEFVLVQMKKSSKNQFGFIQDYLLAYFLSKTSDNVLKHFFEEDYQKLRAINGMTETLVCMYQSNMNMSQCAKDMFLHRNTILFRLNRLKEILHLDPTEQIGDRIYWYLFAEYIISKTN
jgi:carbohydrate diacid regulator